LVTETEIVAQDFHRPIAQVRMTENGTSFKQILFRGSIG